MTVGEQEFIKLMEGLPQMVLTDSVCMQLIASDCPATLSTPFRFIASDVSTDEATAWEIFTTRLKALLAGHNPDREIIVWREYPSLITEYEFDTDRRIFAVYGQIGKYSVYGRISAIVNTTDLSV